MSERFVAFTEMHQLLRSAVDVFSTSIIGSNGRTDEDSLEYVGGGTLVMITDVPGVLTADHVWQSVLDGRYPLVAAAGTRSCVTQAMRIRDCRVHRLSPTTPDDGFGPDLAFVELPTDYALNLCNSGKRLYNVTGSRPAAMRGPQTVAGAPRLLYGIPWETTSTFVEGAADGDVTRMLVGTHAITSRVEAVHVCNGYDYVDVSLQDRQGDAFPSSMLGFSGSGLWRVGAEDNDGRFHADTRGITLDGVVLQHLTGSTGGLRCHGRESLYRFHDALDLERR